MAIQNDPSNQHDDEQQQPQPQPQPQPQQRQRQRQQQQQQQHKHQRQPDPQQHDRQLQPRHQKDPEDEQQQLLQEPPPPPPPPQAGLKYRIGYWWSDKKSQRLNATKLRALFAERQCELVKLDFDRHLEQQGPFHLIVHKISDILVKADQGDQAAKRTISVFESYVRKHPHTILLDPLDNNRALLDRYKQYRLIEQSDLAKENVVFTPPFVHLTSTNIHVNRGRIRRSKITFPIVCKPILAQGSQGAHQMCIIFNEAGLKDVKPPCVAQSFVNHNAKLFKLFVIKDKYYTMERPSLKNFQADDRETVFFYSHDISKPNSSSSLTELDEVDKQNLEVLLAKWGCGGGSSSSSSSSSSGYLGPSSKRNLLSSIAEVEADLEGASKSGTKSIKTGPKDEDGCAKTGGDEKHADRGKSQQQFLSPLKPNDEILNKIVRIFSEKLGLTFYGIDIIIEHGTNRYAIIDMNTFPGYDGVEDFLTIFCDVVCCAIPKEHDLTLQQQLQQQQQQQQTARLLSNKRKPTEHDSGIEST